MTDLDKLLGFLRDLESLDKMSARYPADSELGKAVAACLEKFSERSRTLNAFFERPTITTTVFLPTTGPAKPAKKPKPTFHPDT